MKKLTLILFCSVFALAACGDDDEETTNNANNSTNNATNNTANNTSNNGEETPEDDGCEHMEEGPFANTDAGATAEDAVDLGDSHTKNTIKLNDDGNGMFTGYLSFENAEDSEIFLFFGADVDVTVTEGGNEVTAESTSGAAASCANDILKGVVYDFEVATYVIQIGPTDQEMVDLVYIPAGTHGHEE